MRVDATNLMLFLGGACIAIALGAVLLRRSQPLGWLVLIAGLAAVALQVLAQLTGRLGAENLWFRSPVFFPAALILLGAAVWWLRRPAPRALRFGLPAVLLVLLGAAALLARIDGRSAPLAMLIPTRSQPAPELSYFDESGRVRFLSELRGKVVLLNFWATWCSPCRKEMPLLSKMQREHGDDGLVVLYVSLEEPAVLEPFLAANRFEGVQGRLDRAPAFYDAGKFYPLSYLIDRDGRVAVRWSGRPKEDWLRAEIERGLGAPDSARVAQASR
jgi:cytochrome c biogenesis protein CcmG/thiol:disulfide interchange protein DsbE